MRLPLGVAAHRRSVDLVVELGETAAVLPERLLVENWAGISAGQRALARRSDQRKRRHWLMRSGDQLAQVPEALQIRNMQARAIELDEPDAILRAQDRTLRRFGLRRPPEQFGHQPCGVDLAHLLRQREALTEELHGRFQIALLFGHAGHREERRGHRAVHVADPQCAKIPSKL